MRRLFGPLLLLIAACSEAGDSDVGRDQGTATDGGTVRDLGRVDQGSGPGEPAADRLEVQVASATVAVGGRVDLAVLAFGGDFPASGEDVTEAARFAVEPFALGQMQDGTFVAGPDAGQVRIRAAFGGQIAFGEVTIRFEAVEPIEVDGEPALPDDPEAVFDGASPVDDRVPEVLYPTAGTLLPRNLGRLEIHFRRQGFSLFRIEFDSPTVDVTVHTRCQALGPGCVFPLERTLYDALSDAAAGRDPVQIRVTGTDSDVVATSQPSDVSFSADRVEGALYYWTTSARAIMRVDFGAGNEPERFFPEEGNGTCFGCHALAPNGEKMTLSRNGQNQGQLFLLDVASRDILLDGVQMDEKEQFQSWSPDSKRFAAIWGDDEPPDTNIRIRDGETGEVLETIPLGHEPTHPDWSPAGDRIAYTRVTEHKTSQRPERGGISVVEALPGGGWTTPFEWIAPEDGFNYYNPAFGLDGSFMLYNRSVCGEGRIKGNECDGDADESAELWAIASAGGDRIRLDRANAPGPLDDSNRLTNTFPRWAPFEGERFEGGGGRIWWMTFSSRRQYGLRSPPGTGQLLWMAAIDPDAILRGEDGSFPAFALPFQDLTTSNHIGQWTQKFVPVDPDPGGPRPDAGPQCKLEGESCESSSECCSGLVCRLGTGDCGPNI